MPHFVIEYSAVIEQTVDMEKLMQTVFDAAAESGTMDPDDIKIRALPYHSFRLAKSQDSFVHVNCKLLAGRTIDEKVKLSIGLRRHLSKLLPRVYSISIDIIDMDPVAYKKRLLDLI